MTDQPQFILPQSWNRLMTVSEIRNEILRNLSDMHAMAALDRVFFETRSFTITHVPDLTRNQNPPETTSMYLELDPNLWLCDLDTYLADIDDDVEMRVVLFVDDSGCIWPEWDGTHPERNALGGYQGLEYVTPSKLADPAVRHLLHLDIESTAPVQDQLEQQLTHLREHPHK